MPLRFFSAGVFRGQLESQRLSKDPVPCEDGPMVFRASMEDLIDPRCGAEPGVDWGIFHGLIMFEIEGFTSQVRLLQSAPRFGGIGEMAECGCRV